MWDQIIISKGTGLGVDQAELQIKDREGENEKGKRERERQTMGHHLPFSDYGVFSSQKPQHYVFLPRTLPISSHPFSKLVYSSGGWELQVAFTLTFENNSFSVIYLSCKRFPGCKYITHFLLTQMAFRVEKKTC